MSVTRKTTSSEKTRSHRMSDSQAEDSRAQSQQPPMSEQRAESSHRMIRLKLVGVGGAGCNAISHIATLATESGKPLAGVELVAINTDLQALEAVTGVAEKIQIGSAITHGLGTGGDSELGVRAAQQDVERLNAVFRNTDVVFIAAGLGGGAATGASPILARLAKEHGAMVLAFVSMPFGFEGDRRRQLALAGLEQLKAHADAVICIQNDKLFKVVGEHATVLDAFKRGNEMVASGVQSIWQLLSRKGLINLDFADLRATLGSKHSEGIFSYGEGEGADKARNAVKAVMESPLFDGGEALSRTEGVLISILGGPDLTLTDVQKAVEPISRLANRAHVIMGAAIDDSFKGKLGVTVIATTSIVPRRPIQPVPARTVMAARQGESGLMRPAATKSATPPVDHDGAAVCAKPSAPKKEAAKARQETLPLEGVSRGRFDKSEPTLYEGEDLDVPTYLRRGISLKR